MLNLYLFEMQVLRKKAIRFFLPILLLLLSNQPLSGTHIAGAEFQISDMGNMVYRVNLILYRDCAGVALPQMITLAAYSDSCNQSINFQLFPAGNPIEITGCAAPATTCNGGIFPGYQKQTFQGIVTLPTCQRWEIFWSTCCRGLSANTNQPMSSNLYINARILNDSLTNSSPVFSPILNSYACTGDPFNYSFHATDPDGDSLSYALVAALDQANVPLSYLPPYSPTYPLITITGNVNLNPTNGNFIFETNTQQNVIVVVEVTEWRNGIAIGTTKRDIVIPVINCGNVLLCGNNLLTGNVYKDANANCTHDGGDSPLEGWLVEVNPGPRFTLSDVLGNYYFLLDSGNFVVTAHPLNLLFNAPCPASRPVNFIGHQDTSAGNDFAWVPDILCPWMSVDINTWGLRPCLTSYVTVNYCNTGTDTARNGRVEVSLDTNLSYLPGGTGNLLNQNGNVLNFGIGNVPPGDCGVFTFHVRVACDPNLTARTLCLEAHIFPDSNCIPPDTAWDRSSVSVNGYCENDSLACFIVTNTGSPNNGNMQGPTPYRFFVNNQLVYSGTLQLPGGTSDTLCWPAQGNTIRLEVDQRPGHPGNSHPNDVVELCGNPNQVTGQVNGLPHDDLDEFIDVLCLVVVNSLDPNEKIAVPYRLTQDNLIDANQLMEYTINFQNVGTAPAINVVIKDTLDLNLDLGSFRLSGSSHPVSRFSIQAGNILKWSFMGIQLPDSGSSEPASHGFVKYKIKPLPGTSLGTVIENRAAITFDINAPLITHTVFNTIGEILIIGRNDPLIYDPNQMVSVFPNPSRGSATFEVAGLKGDEEITVEWYTLHGQKVRSLSVQGQDRVSVDRDGLSSGIYLWKVLVNQSAAGTGKLILLD